MFKVHRKNAITNVQLKANSGNDPKILKAGYQSSVQEFNELEDSPHITQQIKNATPEPTWGLHGSLSVCKEIYWRDFNEDQQEFNNIKSPLLTKSEN